MEVNSCWQCGSNHFKVVSPSGRKYFIKCRNCGNTGPGEESDEEAVKAWNNRGKSEAKKTEARTRAEEIMIEALEGYEDELNSIGATKREQFGRAMQMVRDHYNIQQTRPGR